MPLADAFDRLSDRRVLLFGGKGGVGKTTLSMAAALHFADTRPTILFTTDPASNLADLFDSDAAPVARLQVESLDAGALYARFLEGHLESFLEIGDRGTYLEREELRRLLELSLPGVDELMAWMHIGELAEEHPESLLIVDTAPTGHTLRMLNAADHFAQLALALDAMQEKHRALVRQFTRRDVRDAIDAFIAEFERRAAARRELLADADRTAFIPVTLSEPIVVEQTTRLIREIAGIDVPFVILNRATLDPDCDRDRDRMRRDDEARARLAPHAVVDGQRSCVPLDSTDAIRRWTAGAASSNEDATASPAIDGSKRALGLREVRVLFLAGKGGVGKTSSAASIALQLARPSPEKRYVVISVDPAHSLLDLFQTVEPPPNLTVEAIDTKAKWKRFREAVGDRIETAVTSLTPRGVSLQHDTEAMRHLLEIAPPGADELFAITRLADLIGDEEIAGIIVDTAPTGHFLRLLDLPKAAGEWVREFMRLLLRYRELIPAGSLGEELVRASRTLKQFDEALHGENSAVIVVTRPERIVIAETTRLIDNVQHRGIRVGGVIANYVTPATDCACDASMRVHELRMLAELPEAVVIERRDNAPASRDELASLVPL